MAIEFVTLISDYENPTISRRMMREIKYRLPSYLSSEKLNGVFLMGKRNELFDTQSYWKL
ncbi:MAG: hypothetical protein PHC34_08425 [Candidatus Gastranaerophilales bacterium]|nr:hypothetical protein [Candidatus Gastranaerophilales bacterium]